ncbi:YL1 nuclear protein-domain-containing protein [Boeremia exigua]|uniref:YL1 nuclear protein-domain-containing protein n=1 Tax=Boeremia exigua TaxID=749465 RepID=UPI001E8DB08A|nr:YL1 nuclear protein-domain-containing protein [Boeremia exigua]KAH6625877.1 YL1 nuclear protein-domain-containing protein [Boeremia exigua]
MVLDAPEDAVDGALGAESGHSNRDRDHHSDANSHPHSDDNASDDNPSDDNEDNDDDDDDNNDDAPVALMVTSRARRANAGNRMSTLLATAAEAEEWGEEWEEVANEEEFKGGDVNEAEDYNMDSSESEEDNEPADDDEGEKELRKAERRERSKKRKAATNPFAARAAVAARKRVKIDPESAPARPKKKSERASWIPTEEDGPIRTSSRRQTVANKESTLAKLQEKDRRRDDTLAMMKAAEARKKKDEPKPLTQAERLAEAARQERINKKTLHRWEEAEEARAAERQAKIDALKNRQIEGPFIRYYSGPAVYVDDKLKYAGKDAPTVEQLEEKLNKEPPDTQPAETADPQTPRDEQPAQPPMSSPEMFSIPASQSIQPDTPLPWASGSHAATSDVFMGGDVFMGSSHNLPYSTPATDDTPTMFAPPQNQDSFLYGIDQYATPQPAPSTLPPNPFTQPQNPPPASTPLPPRRRTIRRTNLTLITLFSPALAPPTRRPLPALKDRDRPALLALCSTLFAWSPADASAFLSSTLALHAARTHKARLAHQLALHPPPPRCAVTNKVARYRDPETGIVYRDARAFGVLRGVVGGGFVWAGALGCYVGGRAMPLQGTGGVGFLGMPAVKGVPGRFLEMARGKEGGGSAGGSASAGAGASSVKTETETPGSAAMTPAAPPATRTAAPAP